MMSFRQAAFREKARGFLLSSSSPDGEGPKGVQGFPLLPGENGRSHANGELIDLNVQAFGRQEMPALMDCNEQSEEEDADDDV